MSIEQLITVSRRYGADPDYVVAGGGNTSWKNGDDLYIKGSGVALETITESGFVRMDRSRLAAIWSASYPEKSAERETAVLADLMAARRTGEEAKRPSVETLLHDILPYAFVVHTHPALVNGITCSARGEEAAKELFGDSVLWIPSINPGYILASRVRDDYAKHLRATGKQPSFILLQNHGIFVAADTVSGIDETYSGIMNKILSHVKAKASFTPLKTDAIRDGLAQTVSTAIRSLTGSAGSEAEVFFATDSLIASLVESKAAFSAVASPFTPDHIVYAGSDFLFIDSKLSDPKALLAALGSGYSSFVGSFSRTPKLVAVRGLGVFGVGANGNAKSARLAVELFRDAVKIASYVESFGGPRFMTREQVDFINNWEVETYRSKISTGNK
jgi:rhamnose utilization protein RhaD (predicted bifunctional aldolase and dehydrogenase)